MKTKMFLKQSLSAFFLAAIMFYSSSISASAAAWGVTVDNSGNIGAAVGSSNDALSAVTGNGYYSGGSWALTNPYGLPSGSILGIASNLLFWLLAIFAVAGIIGFVLSGIYYLLAGADEDNAKKGKNGMTWSIIGIIVGLSGFVIMQAVSALLGGGSKTF